MECDKCNVQNWNVTNGMWQMHREKWNVTIRCDKCIVSNALEKCNKTGYNQWKNPLLKIWKSIGLE